MEAALEKWKDEKLWKLLGFHHAKAPNQVTGYLCKLFFEETNRENVIEAVASMKDWKKTWQQPMSEEKKQDLKSLLQMFSVIGRVLASDSLIRVMDFQKYCMATYIFILEKWPWARV